MKKLLAFILLVFFCVSAQAQFGASSQMYSYSQNLSGTGVGNVYVFKSLSQASLSFTSSSASVSFYRYSKSLSDKELVPQSEISTSSLGSTTTYTLSGLQDSRGYLAEQNGGTSAVVWIVDYSQHEPILTSIEPIEKEDQCELLTLSVTKSDELDFYGVSGNKRAISRLYTISYNNQEWDEESKSFKRLSVVKQNQTIGTEYIIDAPLLSTEFKLKGDQFAESFGMAKELSSPLYSAVAVEAHITAEQVARDSQNELSTDVSSLGGSAPVTINFSGYANEPVASYYTWFIFNKKDLNNYIVRYTDKDINNYIFDQSGDFVVKLEVADRNSICVDTTQVEVKITESKLEIPNYFSPDSSPGINDEFRVAYKSLIKFKCTIFNRWGNKLYQWTDPAKGWDGRYNGKFVNTGVYFYVIEAEGSDGIKYKEGGDINIVRGR